MKTVTRDLKKVEKLSPDWPMQMGRPLNFGEKEESAIQLDREKRHPSMPAPSHHPKFVMFHFSFVTFGN